MNKSTQKISIIKKVVVGGLSALTVASLAGFAPGVLAADGQNSSPDQTQVEGRPFDGGKDFNKQDRPGFDSKKDQRGHDGKHRGDQKRPPRLTREQREALKKAIADKDYEAWAKILKDRPIAEKINAGNFDKFVEALTLAKNGDKEAAKKIFDELGLKRPKHRPDQRPDKPSKEKRQAIKKALEAGDYEAWLKAVGEDSPITKKINADNFDRFVEAYNLFKSGDKEGAAKIFKELGVKRPHRPGHHGHRTRQGRDGQEAGGAHFGPGSANQPS